MRRAGGIFALVLLASAMVNGPRAPLRCGFATANRSGTPYRLAVNRRANCSPAQSAPASVAGGVVFSGSVDGHLRAYATKDGSVVGTSTRRRNSGPAIAEGIVLTTSGYGLWGGQSDNVLLAFSVEGK